MKHLTKLSTIIALLLVCYSSLHGQDLDLIVKSKMDDVFRMVDKSKIETGLLSDYGCLLVTPYAFNGVLTDSNYVSPEIWKGLYLSMYTTRINGYAVMKEPSLVFSALRKDSPAMFYLQYNRIDENAVKNGLLILNNERLYETGRPGTPYLKEDLFAVTLPDVYSFIPRVSFTFRRENYISNLREMPVQVAVCFAPESGYQAVAWNQPVSHTFSFFGDKEIKVRIKFANGKTLESHARIKVDRSQVQLVGSNVLDTTFAIARTNEHNGGQVQIKYAAFNKEKKKLIRPLVIADESDILKFISEDEKEVNLEYWLGNKDTRNMIESINNLYDLVYVDNNDGFDDIFRNARLFEDAIVRINGMRNSICDSTCVVGLGMGGLTARYALKELENRGIGHLVSKLITVNSPHKGLNIPIGLQGLLKHLDDIRIVKKHVKDLSAMVSRLCDMLNRPAMKQMLIYSIDDDFNYQSDHTDFMQRYEAMGMPAGCRNVAVSNGSYYGGVQFQPGSRFFELEYSNGLLNFLLAIFTLGELKFEAQVNTLSNKQASEIYYGNLYYRTWLLFNSKINCNKKTLRSTDGMVALDSAPGSQVSVKSFLDMEDDLMNAFKLPGFCFIPTVSALAVNDWEKELANMFDPSPRNSVFDRLYAPQKSYEYTELTACKDFLMQELAPQITGNGAGIMNDTRLELNNIPVFLKLMPSSLIHVDWQLSNDNFRIVSSSGFGVVVSPARFGKGAEIKAVVTLSGTGISYETFPVYLRSDDLRLTGSKFISPVAQRYSINTVPQGAVLTWRMAPNLEVVEKKDNYIVLRDNSGPTNSNPLWVEAELNIQGNLNTQRMELKRARVERVELECLQNKVVDMNGEKKRRFTFRANVYPKGLPEEEVRICWSARAYNPDGIFVKFVDLDVRTSESACYTGVYPGEITPIDPPVILKPLGFSGGFNPDIYDLTPSTPDVVAILVPPCQYGDSIFGSVKASVKDNYKTSLSAEGSVWNYYVSVCYVSPNPCNTMLTVSQGAPGNAPDSRMRTVPEPVVISLYNDFGLVRSVEADTSQPDIRMEVSDLPNGTYYLNILKSGELTGRQVVWIKH